MDYFWPTLYIAVRTCVYRLVHIVVPKNDEVPYGILPLRDVAMAWLLRITNMVENGLIERWRRLYYPRDICSIEGEISELPDPATVHDTEGAFGVLAGGVILALVLLLLELGLFKLCKNKAPVAMATVGWLVKPWLGLRVENGAIGSHEGNFQNSR
ncbi:hypothetical protein CAPTEDRAFT_222893 [Capitella teleta]|uniref:Uncharacterized protein n=1 Tax=Capitella teleta TaxID=283909 RepID=R7T6Y4_CAPTE|nr:hypothetical protein CAPTEDRAFT_222893 [Capitella teleta]|eukprot:ELT89369.1 hypothetical protein CAPTEDRAFT_222893 [Capitella teleta]